MAFPVDDRPLSPEAPPSPPDAGSPPAARRGVVADLRLAIATGRTSRLTLGFTIIELLSVVAIIGVLSAIVIPHNQEAIDKARVARAIGDLRVIANDINSADSLPANLAVIHRDKLLDPWGNPYVYLLFPASAKGVPPGARTDRFVVAINSRYDLYSMGPDGVSSQPLTATQSKDDVVMGNDGGFYGLATKY